MIIVTKSILVTQWAKAIKKFTGLDAGILQGATFPLRAKAGVQKATQCTIWTFGAYLNYI